MSDITPHATTSFSGFHIRQTPMTQDEQLRADRADVMRGDNGCVHGATLCAEATAIFVSMRLEVFERLTQLRNA